MTSAICLDVESAAAAMGVCSKTIRQFIDSGDLPTVQLPSTKRPGERNRRVLILADDLRAFAQKHRAVQA